MTLKAKINVVKGSKNPSSDEIHIFVRIDLF